MIPLDLTFAPVIHCTNRHFISIIGSLLKNPMDCKNVSVSATVFL
jgi:hypothetical protein